MVEMTVQKLRPMRFLDNGSDTTLCLSSLAESLGVSGKPVRFSLSSINAENIPKSGYEVSLNVFSLDGDVPILLDRVWTVDRLPLSKRNIPSDEDVSQWPHLEGIKFIRLDGEEKAVSILIGNDVPEAHWVMVMFSFFFPPLYRSIFL